MLLPVFEYHRPNSLAEAFEVLDQYGEKAKVLAGGTDLLVNMKRKVAAPDHVVGLEKLADLTEIQASGDRIGIGALTTAAALAASSVLKNGTGILAESAGKLGSPQVRTRATIGGNLCTARPAADMPLPLLVLGARVVLAGSGGQREVSIDEFFLGPGETVVRLGEILTSVVIDKPKPGTGGGYMKLGLRRAMEISLVNVAAAITLDDDGKTIKSAKVALGAVAPTPIRAPQAEKVLAGAKAGDDVFAQAGLAAAQDAKPITDHRGSAEYRRDVVAVLTKRALQAALENGRKQ